MSDRIFNRTMLLKCQHTILGGCVRREDIKLVINKRSPTGAITPNTWHVRARAAQFEQHVFCFLN